MTSQTTVRLFLIGLPAGLIVSGVAAMFLYFRLERMEEREGDRVIARRALTQEELTARVQVLAGRLGERNTANPGALRDASNYLQSSLGPANMGFRVSRRPVGDSTEWFNDSVELPAVGGSAQAEMIVVTANYDSEPGSPGANDNATGLAALMCLAEAFAGTANERTLLFVATVNDELPHAGTPAMGSFDFASFLKARGDRVVAVLALDSLNCGEGATGAEFTASDSAADLARSAMLAFGGASGLPARTPDGPQGRFPADSGADGFARAGFPVVRLTGAGSDHAADTVDSIDFAQVFATVRGAEAVLKLWLNPR